MNLIGISKIMSNNNIGCVVIVDDPKPESLLELLPKEMLLEQLVCYNRIRW